MCKVWDAGVGTLSADYGNQEKLRRYRKVGMCEVRNRNRAPKTGRHGDDIVNELFNIDVSTHLQATTASRNATYMWTEMKKRAGNTNFQWRDFIALSAGHNCIEVQNELVTQTHGVHGFRADHVTALWRAKQ